MNVDGQEIRELKCELASGGIFASMAVVASLAAQKEALDKCAPAGGAFAASWRWENGKTSDVKVSRSSASAKDACVTKALEKVESGLTGTCTAVVLVGEPEAARKAAAGLKE
jgi:hypothetical protein